MDIIGKKVKAVMAMLSKRADAHRVRAFFHWVTLGRIPAGLPALDGKGAAAGVRLDLFQSDLFQSVENARREWQQACDLFNEAREPQLVDHAIHVLAAAEVRYAYYIRQAKKEYQVLR
jgi:hypothetical protein